MQENTLPEATLLDWRGLSGPDVIVNTAKVVKRLAGRPSVLRILADDHAFPTDLASWCRVTRSQLLQIEQDPTGAFAALVQVNGAHEATRPVERYDAHGQYDLTNGNLDCRGMLCPEPILALARALRGLPPGSAVAVLADDPAFPMDVRGWCRSTGATLESLDERGGVYQALIRGRRRSEQRAADTTSDTIEIAAKPGGARSEPRHGATAHEDDTDADTVLGGAMVPARPVPRATPPAAAAAVSPLARVSPASPFSPVAPRSPASPFSPAAPPVGHAVGYAAGLGQAPPALPERGGIRVDLGGLAPEDLVAVLDSLSKVSVDGESVTVTGMHKQFARNVVDWCARGGHALVQLETSSNPMVAVVRLRHGVAQAVPAEPARVTALIPAGNAVPQAAGGHGCAIMIMHSDMEAVLAALLTANTAAAAGMPASILFALWGINVLRGDAPRRDVPAEKVSLVQRVLKLLMPRGPRRQRLGKLSFAGAGGLLVRFIMRRKKMHLLEDVIAQACALNVRFLVCTMSMSILGVTRRDLMDLPNIEMGGIAAFVDDARAAAINLVF